MDDVSTFAETLEDVALQLSSLNPLVEEPDDIATTTAAVIGEYQRLSEIAQQFGMTGVAQTATWLHDRLVSYQEMLPEAVLELLQGGQLFGWIELAAFALREPEDQTHLPAVAAELMNEAWPEPPPPELLENLLVNLRVNALQSLSTEEEAITTAAVNAEDATTQGLTAAPNPLAWDADIHPELLAAYLQETPGQIAEAARLIHLISQGDSTAEQKRHAARLAHTIKGASGVVGITAIAAFTHRLEDILDLDIHPHLAHGLGQTLAACADCLETLFDHLQEHKPLPDEYEYLLSELDTWESRLAETTLASPEEANVATLLPTTPLVLPDFIAQSAVTNDDDTLRNNVPTVELPRSTTTHVSVPLETVQRLLNLAGELITSTSQIAEQAQHTLAFGKQIQQQEERIRQMLEELSETIDRQSSSLPSPSTYQAVGVSNPSEEVDRLELEAYNDLHSTSNLLTESIADNRELTRHLQQQIRQISEQVYQQQRLQRQLSETILRTRLIPVQSIVTRLERTVRETCRRTGKQANISIIGQNLQVDTDILQGLNAPLLHMLRNAVDHGIEAPDDRQAAGKPPAGQITLHFEQKGNHIHLTLTDDGKGLDPAKIRARAIERGMILPDSKLSETDTLRLILQPGFTTRDDVSDISGRGVGMDVVQTAVEDLQGLLHISSEVGHGTTIRIQVPLTLIATNALLVRAGGNLIAIPSNTIQQLLYVGTEQYEFEGENWFIRHQEQLLEVLQLAQLLGWQASAPDLRKGHSLLIVASEQKSYALYVEDVQQPRDIVVKSLAPWLNLAQGVSGACTLANGAVAPVLDVLRILRHLENGQLTLKRNQIFDTNSTAQRSRILVVDDSLSNRKSLSLMLEQMGHQAVTAVDGLEALQRLHEQSIELVLTDLEMPRMNGLEMTQAIRIWPEKCHLPIVMITSRGTQKHRTMAQQAGVDAYLTKPVDYDTLNKQLQRWLHTQLAV